MKRFVVIHPVDELREGFHEHVRHLGYPKSALNRDEGGQYSLPAMNDMWSLYRAGYDHANAENYPYRRAIANISALIYSPKWTTLPTVFSNAVKRFIQESGHRRTMFR